MHFIPENASENIVCEMAAIFSSGNELSHNWPVSNNGRDLIVIRCLPTLLLIYVVIYSFFCGKIWHSHRLVSLAPILCLNYVRGFCTHILGKLHILWVNSRGGQRANRLIESAVRVFLSHLIYDRRPASEVLSVAVTFKFKTVNVLRPMPNKHIVMLILYVLCWYNFCVYHGEWL